VYSDGPIRKYLEDAASGSPTPGGGSVSALAGALGAAMACMAANFTVGRKKYRHVEDECRQILGRCEAAWRLLLELTDADTEAYAHVSRAYGLPRETPDQKAARSEAIQQALRVAMEVPLKAFRACTALIDDLDRLVEIANPNLISDVGVAAMHAYAGLRGCRLNVEINLAFINDEAFVAEHRREIEAADARAKQTADAVIDKVYRKIRGD